VVRSANITSLPYRINDHECRGKLRTVDVGNLDVAAPFSSARVVLFRWHDSQKYIIHKLMLMDQCQYQCGIILYCGIKLYRWSYHNKGAP
jgi:hypothetical protein